MHYCFLTTGTWDANASFVRLREFGNEMIARGHRVTYVADDIPYNRDVLKLHPQATVRLTPDPSKFSQLAARRRLLREINPDYVHILNPFVKAYLALASTRFKVVGDWDEWPARRPLGAVRHQMEVFLDRWLRRRACKCVVASRYLQEQFREQFGIEAAYLPYAAYLPSQSDGPSPFTEPTAVYMGNLYPAYDHDLLIDAARLLKARGKQPRLLLLGHGPDLQRWQTVAADEGLANVQLPGFVKGEALWQHLRHAHVLLFPIRPTLLNLCRCPSKTFAYAQTRRPVITNRVGEVPQVLGEKAEYVEPTPQAFADAIERAMAQAMPDVDYGVEQHNWSARTEALLTAIQSSPACR